MTDEMLRILVRRANDVGSAVAHRLCTAGFAVLIHDDSSATTSRRAMVVVTAVFEDVLSRMRKRAHAEPQLGLTALTIGLGPNFPAGQTADLIVETAWGGYFGHVSNHGATRRLEGEPLDIRRPCARARHLRAGRGRPAVAEPHWRPSGRGRAHTLDGVAELITDRLSPA